MIEGSVVNENGTPVQSVDVILSCKGKGARSTQSTDKDGRYTFLVERETMYELTYVHSTLATKSVTQLDGKTNQKICKVLVPRTTTDGIDSKIATVAELLRIASESENAKRPLVEKHLPGAAAFEDSLAKALSELNKANAEEKAGLERKIKEVGNDIQAYVAAHKIRN
jgi:hypothetical protein